MKKILASTLLSLVLGSFVFLIHTCRVMLDVSPTLTTTTLHDSRLGWFEAACDRKHGGQPGWWAGDGRLYF